MGRQLSRLFSSNATVAFWCTLMALVLLLAACGTAPELPEPTEAPPEPTEVEHEVTVVETVVVEPTTESAPEPTEAPPPTPSSPGAVVQEELERLAAGRIVYNPPAEMMVDQTERVEARISLDTDAPLTEGLRGVGAPVEESIRVSSFMKVRLVGDAFDIVAFSSEEQVVPTQGYTEWAWDVTPTKAGERTLCLIVTALVKATGAEGQKDLPIIERQIRVKVKPGSVFGSFLRDNRGWIFPAVLVPLAAACGRWVWQWQKRRKPPGDPGTGGSSAQS